jgi:Ribonuclease G/E
VLNSIGKDFAPSKKLSFYFLSVLSGYFPYYIRDIKERFKEGKEILVGFIKLIVGRHVATVTLDR